MAISRAGRRPPDTRNERGRGVCRGLVVVGRSALASTQEHSTTCEDDERAASGDEPPQARDGRRRGTRGRGRDDRDVAVRVLLFNERPGGVEVVRDAVNIEPLVDYG